MPAKDSFKIELLDSAKHQREAFDCGIEILNRYLAKQARLDVKRSVAGCWLLIDTDSLKEIIGYYTLSTAAVLSTELSSIPKTTRKHFPNYPQIGALLLGRLAVALNRQGEGFGGILLIDALRRCRHQEIPAVLVIVDPKDNSAVRFYRKFGFRTLNETRMFLPMREVDAWIG